MPSIQTQPRRQERRAFNFELTKCEIRAAASGSDSPGTFVGYAAVFDTLSVNLGGFRERILQGAFRTAIEEEQDVRFLINHNADLVLGRTKAQTIILVEDETGLRVECDLPNTSYAVDLAESMRRGDVDGMSFGFITVEENWPEKDPTSGLPIRDVVRANLFDVSVVTYPAYPATTSELRAEELRAAIAEQNPDLLERARRAAKKLAEAEKRDEQTPPEPATQPAPEEERDETAEQLREQFEQLRAEAGVRIEDTHPQCDGVAVVWNFNNELQSCHLTREAAEAQVAALTSGAAGAAREGILSQVNAEALSAAAELVQAVLQSAGGVEKNSAPEVHVHQHIVGAAGEERDKQVPLPDLKAFRERLEGELRERLEKGEERGWGYEEDWNVWSLTNAIESVSTFLLYADDPNDDDAEEEGAVVAAMKSILSQLSEILAQYVAQETREADPGQGEGEQRDAEPAATTPETDEERRRRLLDLSEREAELLAVG